MEKNSFKSKSFIDNPLFRIISPIILSILIYFLVILVFGTLDQLQINFFRAELILCLLIAYLVSELNHLLISILEKKIPEKVSLPKRIFLQLALSTFLIFSVTSLAVSLYMEFLVGFKSYISELIVFNSFYISFGWCYHAIYFSIVYLKMESDIQLKNEEIKKEAIELQMEKSLRNLKPDFLNQSLETLIILTKKDPDLAENYLLRLADFYRGILKNTKLEFINIEEELENAANYIAILNESTVNSIKLSISKLAEMGECKLLAGCIQFLLEYIVKNAILSTQMPVIIELQLKESHIEVIGKKTDRLKQNKNANNELNTFIESYLFCTGKNIEVSGTDGQFSAIIPILKPEEILER